MNGKQSRTPQTLSGSGENVISPLTSAGSAVCVPCTRGGGTHLVVAGDTLWDIARDTYGSGALYTEIRKANPDKVFRNGDLIFVGAILVLPVLAVEGPCETEGETEGETEVAVTPQDALDKALVARDVKGVLEVLTTVNEPLFRALCGRFDQTATQWLLDNVNATYVSDQDALLQRFRSERTVQAALSLEDALYWAGSSGPESDGKIGRWAVSRPTDKSMEDGVMGPEEETNKDEFALWIRGEEPAPTHASKMNCWEAVMYSAYLGGVIPKQWLVDVHDKAAQSGDYNGALGTALGEPSAVPMTATQEPGRGDVVFMDGLNHVVLSLGTKTSDGKHEVMSLWVLPRDGARFNSSFQRTTIEDINGEYSAVVQSSEMPVTFAPCPF